MPMLEIDLYVIGQLNNETDVLQRVKMPPTKDDWIQVHQNEVSIFINNTLVNLHCKNSVEIVKKKNCLFYLAIHIASEFPSICTSFGEGSSTLGSNHSKSALSEIFKN